MCTILFPIYHDYFLWRIIEWESGMFYDIPLYFYLLYLVYKGGVLYVFYLHVRVVYWAHSIEGGILYVHMCSRSWYYLRPHCNIMVSGNATPITISSPFIFYLLVDVLMQAAVANLLHSAELIFIFINALPTPLTLWTIFFPLCVPDSPSPCFLQMHCSAAL